MPTPADKINKSNHIKSKTTQNKLNKMNKINKEVLKPLLDVYEIYFKIKKIIYFLLLI